jgi:hypothetical protein
VDHGEAVEAARRRAVRRSVRRLRLIQGSRAERQVRLFACECCVVHAEKRRDAEARSPQLRAVLFGAVSLPRSPSLRAEFLVSSLRLLLLLHATRRAARFALFAQ